MSTATFTTAHALPVVTLPELHLAAAVRHVGNVALFLSAPFVGLLYVLAMPVVGLGMLLMVAGRAMAHHAKALRTMALLLAAPFIGLAYALALPLIGVAMLVTLAYKAYRGHHLPASCCAW